MYTRTDSFAERLAAGKRTSLHSPQAGKKITKNKAKHPGEATHDYSNVHGWNKKG